MKYPKYKPETQREGMNKDFKEFVDREQTEKIK